MKKIMNKINEELDIFESDDESNDDIMMIKIKVMF